MSRLARLFSLALLLALCAPFLHAGEPEWTEVRSPHFQVITDAGANKGRDVALRFEQMRHVFGALLLKDKVNIPVPLLIIAFRNSKEMRQHVPLWKGKPVSLAGLFQGSEDRNFILLDLSSPNAFEVVFHEYAHLLLNGNFPRMPAWFDEGFAEYYSTIKVSQKEFEVGDVPEYVPYVLRERGLMPVADLFAVTHDTATYNESGDRRSNFYAQSWLMVHYVFDKKKLAETAEYCKLTMTDKLPVVDAMRRAFKLDPKQFDRELNSFYRSASVVKWTIPMPPGLENVNTYGYQIRKLPLLDAQTEIADLHVHSRDYIDRGVTELENILQQDPNNGRARRSLGYAYLYRQDFPKAAEQFSQAAQLLPNDPRVHYYAASLIQHRGGTLGGDFNAAAMRDHLLKSVELDPEYADAWNLLGFVYRMDQKYPQAVDAMLKAIKLSPREDHYRLNLAYIYLDARSYDDAGALLNYLKTSSDSSVVAQAEQSLARLEQMKAAPARTGRFEERSRPATYDNPKWQKQPDDNAAAQPNSDQEPPPPTDIKIDQRPILWLKGKLSAVSCDPAGSATLTVTSQKKTVRLTTPNYKKLVLIGADAFSCTWSNVPVAVNYRESSPGAGDLVSLEIQ
ncbi:MAG TPA: tetratricopeptide repeat protein [Terriglobales bacterium]|nr:tetratricopeptide repeat protein [Terriglobales bacterium]